MKSRKMSSLSQKVVQSDSWQKSPCPHCENHQVVKKGYTENGKQRYLCRSCKREWRQDSQSLAYDENRREQVMRLYGIVKSYRKVARLCGVDRRTVANWIKHVGVTTVHTKES
jgi:transposase-like protein